MILVATMSLPFHADASETNLDSLRWMLGTWSRTTSKGSTAMESWIEVDRRVFRGQGTVRAPSSDATRLVETLLLVEMSGEIFYLAKVAENERPVAFKLVSSGAQHAVFENSDHDFPQRLEYTIDDGGRLVVDVRAGERGFTVTFSKDAEPDPSRPG